MLKKRKKVEKVLRKYNMLRMSSSFLILNICTISLKENIAFVKLFERLLGSNISVSFTDFPCQGMDNFGYIRVQTFEIYIQGSFLLQ